MENKQIALYCDRQVGVLKGHTDWITQIVISSTNPDTLFTSSRDKTVAVWNLYVDGSEIKGKLMKRLCGHNHIVSDICLSKDGGFVISSSWDKLIKLWDIEKGIVKTVLHGHTNDVMSVAFSSDNRQIVSGSRDRTVRLWNTLGHQKFVFQENGHTDCVSAVLTKPSDNGILVISAGYDGLGKVWGLKPAGLRQNLRGHRMAINSISLSPNFSMLASGGKDGQILIWNLDTNEYIKSLEGGGAVSCVAIHPRYFLLAASVNESVKLFNIDGSAAYHTITPIDITTKIAPHVVSMRWSDDGACLFVGYSDSCVRIFSFCKDNRSK
ncbi:Guanine nucleotide-binding protein subunit beta-like protein [Thelohanellus kitauei]|uniref:Small ribosomal subunit protein RACK1 n=1 Tax=Thelohanellus kitauei TaxID=669202 RepID=A0A0C2MWJ8_THEKT|nr:Guanine nucleotide-binding protein subunit beta-like protein [Thelohanellus kitauei]